MAFCKAIADYLINPKETAALFYRAVKAHVKYVSAVSDGKGVNIYLFGLRKLLGLNNKIPAVYKDPSYTYSSSWYISTWQLSSEYFNGYG